MTRPVHEIGDLSDAALQAINAFRPEVDERFYTEPLSVEMPKYAARLGNAAITLAHAEDNLAGSFKWRGAFFGMQHLVENGADDILVPSAGNHARGAILAAKHFRRHLTVVVPVSAPPAKRSKLKELWPGGKLDLRVIGQEFNESLDWALEQSERHGREILHPFDDINVVSGQGTVIDDVLGKSPDTKHVVIPVGGGGLLAGAARRLKRLKREDITIHAIEAPGSNSLSKSLAKHEIQAAERPNPSYGGLAVRQIGRIAFHEAINYQNLHVHTASKDSLRRVIADYEQDRHEWLRTGIDSLEPTSLVAVAGLEKVLLTDPEGQITVIATGRNESLQPLPTESYSLPI